MSINTDFTGSTEPNATIETVEENTSQIEVPILPNPAEDIVVIADNLGLDSASYTIVTDPTTDKVTLTTTNDNGETITIEIIETNGKSSIKVSPSTIADTTDTTYEITTAVNEATGSSYDSNDFTYKYAGETYVELNIEYANQSEAESACLLYTSPSPRDKRQDRMPSSA